MTKPVYDVMKWVKIRFWYPWGWGYGDSNPTSRFHFYHNLSPLLWNISPRFLTFAHMPRILSIDYGTKRTGIAVSDPLQIIATGLDTVPTHQLMAYLKNYMQEEDVETIVVGEPFHPDGTPAQISHLILGFVRQLKKEFPDTIIERIDESFTSEEAKSIILQSGVRKKKRREKGLVDKISAVLILQDFMEKNNN